MAKFTPTTAYTERLASTISASSTTIRVSSVLDRDGVALPISATNKGYFTLEPGTSREESIVCTGVNTVTNELTGCVRGLAASGSGETGSSARAYSHNAGTKIVMTDIAQFFGNFVNAADPEADTGYVPTNDKNLTTKEWVENRNGYWEGAVADFAALPITGNQDGAARVTLDDSKVYVWSEALNAWQLAGAGGGAGTVYITTLLGTEAVGDDNMTFQLTSGSFPDKKYLQVYKNGVLMSEGAGNDYIATGSNQAVFNDAVLDDDVITLLVVSVDLYNPDWNSVNADMLPDLTDTHDIGSTTKKFKDLHLSGDVTFGGDLNGDGSNLDDGANGKLTSGTAANELVRLDGDAEMPAVSAKNILITENKNAFSVISSANTKINAGSGAVFGPSSPLTYTKNKEILFKDVDGTVKVVFTLNYTGGGSPDVYVRIYKNDAAVGTERTSNGTYSEDISVLQGDKIQIYVKVGDANTLGWRIDNFLLQYDKITKGATNTVNL